MAKATKSVKKDVVEDELLFDAEIVEGDTTLDNAFTERFATYATTTVASRAIPQIEDGLLPVMRRSLVVMNEENVPWPKFKKAAAFVGNTLGSLHAHGDSSVYNSMIGLSRDFSKLNTLIDGQGNLGNAGGDGAAAMRYTELRLSKFAKAVYFQDLNESIVPHVPNFDSSRKEPVYLPSAFPMFLVNSTEGIASGFSGNMPTHNLNDILACFKKFIKNPDIDTVTLTKDLRPDFPLGGNIVNEAELPNIYESGQGIIKVKATIDIETSGGKEVVVIKDLPPGVTLKTIREKIADDMKSNNSKFLDKISDMYDESSIKVPVRFVIVPKRGTDPSLLINLLYSNTLLLKSVSYISNILYKSNLVETPSLSKMFEMWLEYRTSFIEKRANFYIKDRSEKITLKKALYKAHAKIDEVIKIVKSSKSDEDSIEKLRKLLTIASKEAKYIISIRLQSIANIEKEKLKNEIDELQSYIESQIELISDSENINKLIISEMEDIAKKFNTGARRTKLSNEDSSNANDVRNFIEKEDIAIGISTDNYIYTRKLSELRETKRRTKGSLFIPNKYNRSLRDIYTISNHDDICIFCKDGQVIKAKGYELDAFHKPIGTLLSTIGSREIASIIPVKQEDVDKFFVFVSACGFMKRVPVNDIIGSRSSNFISWKSSVAYEDELVGVSLSSTEEDNILVCLSSGNAMRMNASAVAILNRNSPGRAMITLREGKDNTESVVSIDVSADNHSTKILVICTNSRGKLVDVNDIPLRSDIAGRKTGKKVISLSIDDVMIGGKMVSDDDRVLVNTSNNLTVKVPVSEIRQLGRNAKGNYIAKLNDNDSVVSFTIGAEDSILDDEDE